MNTRSYWRGDALTIHESTQNSGALRHGLARQLGRPVKRVLPREQVFHGTGFRPASTHRLKLGANKQGKLLSIVHEVSQQTSRHDLFPSMCTEITASLYACEHFRGRASLVRTDTQTPGFMRGPWEHFTCFAIESAMDELAAALGKDPVALRIANDTDVDPHTHRPFSSRHLKECLSRGAARFGWDARSAEPGSMKAVDGTLIGWGMAVGAYKASTAPAIARLRVAVDGSIVLITPRHRRWLVAVFDVERSN